MPQSAHSKALENIALHPELFGISHVIASVVEATLRDKNRIVSQPDVVFYCSNGEIYILEYKGNGNGELMARAQDQLTRSVYWFAKYTNVPAEKIHTKIVTGEELKKDFPTRK
jgi:tRNA A37 threonylcarbamoyltransferase TsaD